ISDHSGLDLPAALKCSDDHTLTVTALHSNSVADTAALALVHIAGLAADVSLINLNRPVRPTKFAASLVLQSEPDAMQHEPCGLLGYSDSARDLVRANTVSAIGDHPHDNKPLLQRNRRVLKNGSDLRGELAFCVSALALPLTLVMQKHDSLATAGWAGHDAIRPVQYGHVGQRVIRIREIDYRVLQSLWLLCVAFHAGKYMVQTLICQRSCFKDLPCTHWTGGEPHGASSHRGASQLSDASVDCTFGLRDRCRHIDGRFPGKSPGDLRTRLACRAISNAIGCSEDNAVC